MPLYESIDCFQRPNRRSTVPSVKLRTFRKRSLFRAGIEPDTNTRIISIKEYTNVITNLGGIGIGVTNPI